MGKTMLESEYNKEKLRYNCMLFPLTSWALIPNGFISHALLRGASFMLKIY